MFKKKEEEKLDDPCEDGFSYGRLRHPHNRSKKIPDIYCHHCRARMGCNLCCERGRELVCLRCNDWAACVAEETHGKMCYQRGG